MADDPWAAFRTGGVPTATADASDPWAQFRVKATDAAKPVADDPITATVRAEYEAAKKRGDPIVGDSLTRRILQGATFNAADELLAGALTPFEMAKRKTLSPTEGYSYAKARQNVELEDARKNQGIGGTVAELGGGLVSGSTLARGGLSVFNALRPTANLATRTGASAIDAAGYGAVAGALEGDSLSERGRNALEGGAIGGAVGTAAPAAIKVAGALISPITSNIRARVNPTGVGEQQFARAVAESGRTPQQIADDVAMAAREGQDVFTVADAMGHPGQRALSGVTRSPGQGRTDAVEFLEQRQAGQGRRVSNALAEGFDAPQTAAATEARLTGARDRVADAEYGQVRADANPVDLTRAVAAIDATLQPGVNQIARPQSGIANDSIEGALQRFRNLLTDDRSVLTDFTAVQRVRGELSDAIQAARQAGNGNRARILGGVLREIDTAMETASQGHRAANANFARSSRDIEAVQQGRDASMRGRTEDTVPAFRGLAPQGQEAFRAGYADPLIAQTQGSAVGVNKARPFTSDAFQTEAAAIAPMQSGPAMTRRLGRENTMFETRNQAIGGSRTADNLADQEALRETPSLVARIGSAGLTGNIRNVISLGTNMLSGSTPQVRAEIARLLLQRGGGGTNVHQVLNDVVTRQEIARLLRDQFGSGALAGASLVPSSTQGMRRQ